MKFEKLLAENLLRFGAKNINETHLQKFLFEQTSDELLKMIQADPVYKEWANKNSDKFKLVKAYQYKTIQPEENKVTVPFFNNFVTIDNGSPKPEEMKKAIDAVLEKLKQQGAELEKPETTIDIISTATKVPAGLNPDKAAIAAGRKTIDHTYGLAGDIKKTFADNQAKDDQWGNKYLALKRGEAARDYIRSKGVKADIKIIPKIVEPAEGRKFEIVAKVKGQEKQVGPTIIPNLKMQLTVGLKPALKTTRQVGTYSLGTDWRELYFADHPVLEVTWYGTLKYTPSKAIGEQTLSFSNMKGKQWISPADMAQITTAPDRYYHAPSGDPKDSWPIEGQGQDGAKVYGMSYYDFMQSIGYMTGNHAHAVATYWRYLVSPFMRTLLKSAGLDVLQNIKDYFNWLISQGYTSKQGTNYNLAYSKNYPKDATGKKAEWDQQTIDILTKEFEAGAKQYTLQRQTFDFTIGQIAAAAGGSPTLSTDVKYWGDAVYLDLTTNPASFGDIKKNPSFFEGAKLVAE